MAQKNWLGHQVFTNAVMTGTSTIASQITEIRGFDNLFYEIDFTGTPTGVFTVQVSNSYDPVSNPNAIFIPITLPSTPIAAGGPGEIGIDLNQLGAKWIQLTYTNTSGSGVVNAYISGKAL